MKTIIIFSLLLLTGCATVEPVKVEKPLTPIMECQSACKTGKIQTFQDDNMKCVCHFGKKFSDSE